MRREAHVRFEAESVSRIALDLTSHMPDLPTRGVEIELLLNGTRICALSLIRYGWLELVVRLPDLLKGAFDLEIRTNLTWQPRPGNATPRDDRELSIAVCNLRVN
jgi:hypothetical protein